MRILQIRFKNLNSLAGEWQVDLTDPAFVADGIFAITGPTGAGKTTILDAICLALYGCTPRLGKVTKSGNEIMSRRTSECFAEVTFETQSGRYRCHWSQHRARKKVDGELQAPKHEIADADSNKVLESSLKGVADKVESVTGMDFDRFTRSMLLAQGGFAVFLQAQADERAPILEQITGTEIYSQISMRVHERHREEKEKLTQLQGETAGIVILNPEQEKELLSDLGTKRKEEESITAKFNETGKAIAWLTTIEGLKKDLAALVEEENKLQGDEEAFKPEREKWNRAVQAASLDGEYATLAATRRQQEEDNEASKNGEKALPELEATTKRQAETLRQAELQTVKAKTELNAALPMLQQVRLLDQKLADQKKAVSEVEEECNKDGRKINADKQALVQGEERLSSIRKEWERVEEYLNNNTRDEWLIGGLAGVEAQFEVLISNREEIRQKEEAQKKTTLALEQVTTSHVECQRRSVVQKQQLEEATKRVKEATEALSRLLGDYKLREYRAEKDALLREMALWAKIAELEDHRKKLEDGKPCPLCGATEHPFAEGNVPVPDAIEQKITSLNKRIEEAEAQEAAIKRSEETVNQAHRNLTEIERQLAETEARKKIAESALSEVTNSLRKLGTELDERRQAVVEQLSPLGIEDLPADIASLAETLKSRRQSWQEHTKNKTEIEKQIAHLDGEVKRQKAVIETQEATLTQKREHLEELKKELARGMEERRILFGDKKPEDEERLLNKAVTDAEHAERQARERHQELQQKWNTAKAQLESLKRRIEQRQRTLGELDTKFSAALVSIGFANEEQFCAARLSTEQRAALEAKSKQLEARQENLKARRQERTTRLDTEVARNVTDKSLQELEVQSKEFNDALAELRGKIAAINHQLEMNKAAKERIKEKQAAIDAQKKECQRWNTLHELIGSSDGKKYRNFAQGLTFEIMVGHANRQLQKMTDRYLLIRDKNEPLQLNVIDNYQAGEVRSTKNLSGGESFIVSLSLALGLSYMASKNVRVDSLFLDEGFGTLDEEALDTALDTLAGLQQDGKLIGVISHVAALKERIRTQIQVMPQSGGRSRISGPGCSRVS